MISQREVQRLAFEMRMPEQAIERDYVLTWVLSARAVRRDGELARHPALGTQAVLKGGTAIKKLYLPVGAWHLYGHSHGRLSPQGRSLDVGVDCHNFRPISLDELTERMSVFTPRSADG